MKLYLIKPLSKLYLINPKVITLYHLVIRGEVWLFLSHVKKRENGDTRTSFIS